ncbi:hypothetical protein BST61_g3101 [Cercospora zeina]
MCFHKFTAFRCGCTRLDEQECEAAEEVDINFWRKIDCAYYHSEHVDEQVQCGAGKFYCRTTNDGSCFDKIEKAHDESKSKHFALVSELAIRKRILLSKRDVWLAQGASIPQILALGEVKVLNSYLTTVDHQRQQHEHDLIIWMKVKALAKQHHDTFQLHKQEGPPFEHFLARFHPQVLARINPPAAAPPVPPSPLDIQPPTETLHQKPSLVRSVPIQYHVPQGPVQSAGAFHHANSPAQASVSQRTRAQPQQRAVQNAIPEVRAHQQKLARAKKQKVDPASSPAKSSSVVRRSSRVKDKKINYRDDDSDLSGPFSPMKPQSDSSGFSPGKIDPIDSPVQARAIGRKGSGLLHEHLVSDHKIGDWRRQDSGTFVPGGPFEDGIPQTMVGLKRKAAEAGIASPGGTRLRQEWMADPRLNVGSANAAVMPALPVPQMYGSFHPTMVPDFQATQQIKREGSDTADPVKRFKAFAMPPDLNQGGPVGGGTAMPMQNISPPAPMWFNPLAVQMPDQPGLPDEFPAEMPPAPMDDLPLPQDPALPEQANIGRPLEQPLPKPCDAEPNSDDSLTSDDFDWTLLAQDASSSPA